MKLRVEIDELYKKIPIRNRPRREFVFRTEKNNVTDLVDIIRQGLIDDPTLEKIGHELVRSIGRPNGPAHNLVLPFDNFDEIEVWHAKVGVPRMLFKVTIGGDDFYARLYNDGQSKQSEVKRANLYRFFISNPEGFRTLFVEMKNHFRETNWFHEGGFDSVDIAIICKAHMLRGGRAKKDECLEFLCTHDYINLTYESKLKSHTRVRTRVFDASDALRFLTISCSLDEGLLYRTVITPRIYRALRWEVLREDDEKLSSITIPIPTESFVCRGNFGYISPAETFQEYRRAVDNTSKGIRGQYGYKYFITADGRLTISILYIEGNNRSFQRAWTFGKSLGTITTSGRPRPKAPPRRR